MHSTSTPCLLKLTEQPASQSVATDSRLCRMPGMRYARRAAGGKRSRAKSIVSEVVIVAPFGMLKRRGASWMSARVAVAKSWSKVAVAAESMYAMLFLSKWVQPDVVESMFEHS